MQGSTKIVLELKEVPIFKLLSNLNQFCDILYLKGPLKCYYTNSLRGHRTSTARLSMIYRDMVSVPRSDEGTDLFTSSATPGLISVTL